ncbi:uncharacterized protein LOC130625358 [Hydractinia symbiolongicarpus]|uniref:uncharacterized protein LOC130625358 n=1 Tax=Hydractinia symbiolongicarpus TaxID=13093 RepID=UPI00254F952D|nr:uncharacterized protein LOC130625358 [Hydractinia symbiolongicarpus]
MTEENRKFLYKQVECSPLSIRSKSRSLFSDIRREKREKTVSTKRFRNEKKDATDSTEKREYTVEMVKSISKSIQKKSSNTEDQLKYLRNAFSYTKDFVDAFLSVDNSLYSLVGYLTGPDSTLQLEAAWCVTNMSANDHEHMPMIVKATAPYLVTYLQSGSVLLQDQSGWALGNMAADGEEIRKVLKAQGVISPLISLVKSDTDGVIQSSLFALCNMAKSLPIIETDLLNSDLLDTVQKKISDENTDLNIICELAWLLSYMSAEDSFCKVIVKTGILRHVVHWLCKVRPHQQEYLFAVTPLLRCLGNLIGLDPNILIDIILPYENGMLLPTLNTFLVSNKRHLIKESLWVLSNIFSCKLEKKHVEELQLALPNVSRHLVSAYEIKKEAAICMCHIAYRDDDLAGAVIERTIFENLIDFLKIPDNEMKCLALQFFEITLSNPNAVPLFLQCNGPSYLEALEYNENEEIRNKAVYLQRTYYEKEDEEEEQVQE